MSQTETGDFGDAVATQASAGATEEAAAVGLPRASKEAGPDTTNASATAVIEALSYKITSMVYTLVNKEHPVQNMGRVDCSCHMSCSGICQSHNLCMPSSMGGELVR